MSKLQKSFYFKHDLTKKVVRNLKIVTEKITVNVEAVGYFDPNASVLEPYERWGVDIEVVMYDGVNVRDLLTITGTIEEIEEAAHRFAAELFTEKTAA
jgi:hypothetical protein